MQKLVWMTALVLVCATLIVAAQKQIVRPPASQPSASWSHGILVGNTLYVSGMSGEDTAGKIPDDFEVELKRALENIGSVLKTAGMSPEDAASPVRLPGYSIVPLTSLSA